MTEDKRDIVERLREAAWHTPHPELGWITEEAASEIERLRADIAPLLAVGEGV